MAQIFVGAVLNEKCVFSGDEPAEFLGEIFFYERRKKSSRQKNAGKQW